MDAKTLYVEKTVTLLETMDDVTLVKPISFQPADSVEAALKALGNDQKRLLEVINSGLEQELKDSARKDASGWHTYKVDESGDPTEELNGPFTGDTVDPKKISGMVLNFAKLFGYSNIKDREKRRKIKEDARLKVKNIILNDPDMKKSVQEDIE